MVLYCGLFIVFNNFPFRWIENLIWIIFALISAVLILIDKVLIDKSLVHSQEAWLCFCEYRKPQLKIRFRCTNKLLKYHLLWPLRLPDIDKPMVAHSNVSSLPRLVRPLTSHMHNFIFLGDQFPISLLHSWS